MTAPIDEQRISATNAEGVQRNDVQDTITDQVGEHMHQMESVCPKRNTLGGDALSILKGAAFGQIPALVVALPVTSSVHGLLTVLRQNQNKGLLVSSIYAVAVVVDALIWLATLPLAPFRLAGIAALSGGGIVVGGLIGFHKQIGASFHKTTFDGLKGSVENYLGVLGAFNKTIDRIQKPGTPISSIKPEEELHSEFKKIITRIQENFDQLSDAEKNEKQAALDVLIKNIKSNQTAILIKLRMKNDRQNESLLTAVDEFDRQQPGHRLPANKKRVHGS